MPKNLSGDQVPSPSAYPPSVPKTIRSWYLMKKSLAENGSPSELRQARGDVHVVVRIRVQQMADVAEILGVVPEMSSDEDRARMLLQEVFSLAKKSVLGRELGSEKAPVRKVLELFISFVESVGRA